MDWGDKRLIIRLSIRKLPSFETGCFFWQRKDKNDNFVLGRRRSVTALRSMIGGSGSGL